MTKLLGVLLFMLATTAFYLLADNKDIVCIADGEVLNKFYCVGYCIGGAVIVLLLLSLANYLFGIYDDE